MFLKYFRMVVAAYADDPWIEASCSLALETDSLLGGRPYNLVESKDTSDQLASLSEELARTMQECASEKDVRPITIAAWREYMREYRVKPLDVDVHKLAYWYGETLIRKLSSRGCRPELIQAAKIHRLNVMDSLLFWNIRAQLVEDVFKKLCMTSWRTLDSTNLGKYGTYLIFKSVTLQDRGEVPRPAIG